MKTVDYTIRSKGNIWTVEPLSKRARQRTPDTVEFSNAIDTLEFVRASQMAGYLLAGAHLVDPTQKLAKSRYFTVEGGYLVLLGEDYGPRNAVWEVGDVMPASTPNSGMEAVVDEILTGDETDQLGCDIAFILKKRNIADFN